MTKKLYEYNVDDSFEIFLLIKSADVRMAKNGKPFIAFTFQDQSGQMDGKYWSATSEDIEKYVPGKVVLLNGKRELYNNSPQVKIVSLRLTDASKGEPTSASYFVEHAPMTKQEMEEEFNQLMFEITNPYFRRIVHNILGKYQEAFFEYPAAKRHHHAFVGGLSYHTLSMLRLAKSIAGQYPQINRSLLFAGVIIHDIGKTMELSGAIGTEYTLKGNLLGHIVIMDEEITKACEELGIDESGLDKLIKASYSLLGLATYFTAGVQEVRAWTFKKGMLAPECAGIIHSDFERGFIRAETVSYDDLVEYGSMPKAKEAGRVRLEGKEYEVKDGDIMLFRFNV